MVSWCDVSDHALRFKRYLADCWDGHDIYQTWMDFKQQQSIHVRLLDHINDPKQFSMENYCTQAGIPADTWTEHWSRFRKLNTEYVAIDLVLEQQKLISMLASSHGQHVLVWLSNCLLTYGSLIELNWRRQISNESWMQKLVAESQLICNSCLLYTSDAADE